MKINQALKTTKASKQINTRQALEKLQSFFLVLVSASVPGTSREALGEKDSESVPGTEQKPKRSKGFESVPGTD